MDNTNTTKCKKCGHDKSDHDKFFIGKPDFNHASNYDLTCKIRGCDCKSFEEEEKDATEYLKNYD